MIFGGRHPAGFNSAMELLTSEETCELPQTDDGDAAPGSTSVYIHRLNSVITCGGSNSTRCFLFSLKDLVRKPLPRLLKPRFESSSVVLRNEVFILGGDGNGTAEYLPINNNFHDGSLKWRLSEKLPKNAGKNRACAVKTGENGFIYIGGESYNNRVFAFNADSRRWTELTPMREGRRDHACVRMTLTRGGEDEDGVLVVGGMGSSGILSSAEFYSFQRQRPVH